MEMSSIQIDINLGVYESILRGAIASDLNALQITFDAISHPEYQNRKYLLKQGFTISEINIPPVDFLKQREINKCFKSIIGSLQDYLDSLIAIIRLKNDKISLNGIRTNDELHKHIQTKLEEHLLKVSSDRSLNTQKKILLLLDQPEHAIHQEALKSYFDVRNGLEHHKGIAKTDRIIRYKRLGLASTAGYEVLQLGPLGEGEGLVLKTFDEQIVFDKGGTLLITKTQLDSIVLNLLMLIIPTIQVSAARQFNMSTIESSH